MYFRKDKKQSNECKWYLLEFPGDPATILYSDLINIHKNSCGIGLIILGGLPLLRATFSGLHNTELFFAKFKL